MIEEVIVCDESRIPVVWLVTHEEARAEAEIAMHAKRIGGEVWIWSLTSNNGGPGWEPPAGTPRNKKSPFDEDMSSSPEGAVKCVIDHAHNLEEKVEINEGENSHIVIVFRDPHVFLREDMSFIRMLRDATRELRDTEALIVCISPEDKLPTDLHTDVAVIRPGLPSKKTIVAAMNQQLTDYGLEDEDVDALAESCIGLTLNQSVDALAKSITQFNRIDLDFISRIKTEAISSIPGLTYIGEAPSMEHVGGLAGLKDWLTQRKEGFTQEARDANLPIPRGVLTLGIPGCGKSLIAKAISSYYKMPLVRLNPPDLKGGIVGETESNIRRMQDSIEALNQVIIWIDEFEKGIPKQGVRNVDGGTSDALLLGLLTFMQERKGEAFIVACANDVSALPPELLRKGRWDEIFFVDLPTYEERIDIFKIHLGLRNWELAEDEIKKLANKAENFSGAEIEAACISGRWKAFSKGKPLSYIDIKECLETDIPLYHTMEEDIKRLREWATNRAKPASLLREGPVKAKKTRKPGGRKINLAKMEKIDA
jgi:hypothetical protein